MKRGTSIPVSTAEVYNIWLEHPELASSVDYLAVHILPFWEGVPGSAAVDHAIGAYQKLREAYPGKRTTSAWVSGLGTASFQFSPADGQPNSAMMMRLPG